MIENNGNVFNWGHTSDDYSKYRDIYPQKFYQNLLDMGLCTKGQKVLDIGTGTGVIPRNLYKYGADFTGIDISENQIIHAKTLAESSNMIINFQCVSAEKSSFPKETFDIVTACQCFIYFNHLSLAPHLHKVLKTDGKFAVLYMAWLPFENIIARKSEELVLKYNPAWTGCGEQRHQIYIPKVYNKYFSIEYQDIYDVNVSFTWESWNGRMRSCRGIGASLSNEEIAKFDLEHKNLLNRVAPQNFDVLHYVAIVIMKKKDII